MTTSYKVYNGSTWKTLSNLSVYNGSWQSLRYAKQWDGSNWNTFWDSFQLNWGGEFSLTAPTSGGVGYADTAVKSISGLSTGETITLEVSVSTFGWNGEVVAYKRTPPAGFSSVGSIDNLEIPFSFTIANGDEVFLRHNNGPKDSTFSVFYGSLYLTNITYSPAQTIHFWQLEGYRV